VLFCALLSHSHLFAYTAPWTSTYCTSCFSESDFAARAEWKAPSIDPGGSETVTYPVYVINPDTLQLYFYDVEVWNDSGVINQIPDGGDPEADDSASKGSDERLSSWGLQKLAILGAPDPTIAAAVTQSIAEVDALISSIRTINSEDLDYHIPSAFDLAGNNLAAEINRNAFEGSVERYLASRASSWKEQLMDAVERAFDNYVGESNIYNSLLVTVNFPDGTTVKLQIIVGSNNPPDFYIQILEDRLFMPDGTAISGNPQQFFGTSTQPQALAFGILRMMANFTNNSYSCTASCGSVGNGPDAECTVTCSMQ